MTIATNEGMLSFKIDWFTFPNIMISTTNQRMFILELKCCPIHIMISTTDQRLAWLNFNL